MAMPTAREIEKAWQLTAEPAYVRALDPEDLCGLMALALRHEDAAAPDLDDPFRETFEYMVETTTVDMRLEVLLALGIAAEQRQAPAGAMLWFLMADTAPFVPAKACEGYVMLERPRDDDPLSVIRTVIDVFTGMPVRAVPIFSALLAMGDRRLVPLLLEAEPRLSNSDFALVVNAGMDYATLGAFEFWLGCAERYGGAPAVEEDNTALNVRFERYIRSLKGLANLLPPVGAGTLREVERVFGFPWYENAGEPIRFGEPEPVSRVGPGYGERLLAVAATAPGKTNLLLGLLPHFGIAPQVAPESWHARAPFMLQQFP